MRERRQGPKDAISGWTLARLRLWFNTCCGLGLNQKLLFPDGRYLNLVGMAHPYPTASADTVGHAHQIKHF